jgi:hypothetical protein
MTTMTFAPGWTQTIDTGGTRERDDLLSYISDTYKGLYGFRPRGDTSSMTIGDLRENAAGLERDVTAGIEFMKKCAERTKRNKADHRRAVKYYTTLKPRNNAMEVALRDALDKVA